MSRRPAAQLTSADLCEISEKNEKYMYIYLGEIHNVNCSFVQTEKAVPGASLLVAQLELTDLFLR